MLVYGKMCKYKGWVVSIRDGVLVNGMGCYSPGWDDSKRD